jgi:phage gp37-like protein
MFAEIEQAIIERVKASSLWPYLRTVEAYAHVDKRTVQQFALLFPGVLVVVTDSKVVPVGRKYEVQAGILMYAGSRNLGEQAVKRTEKLIGSYAITETLLGLFTGNDLGLGVRGLIPKGIAGVFDPELDALGISLYMVRFETAFTISALKEGEDLYVDSVGIKYYLKPGDDNPDAVDALTLC